MFAPDGTLSIEEAARACGVSDETIRRRLRADQLPNAFRTGGPTSQWRIPPSDLLDAGLLAQLPSDNSSSQAELAILKSSLHAAEQLLAERMARIEELQRHLDDLRHFLDTKEFRSQ